MSQEEIAAEIRTYLEKSFPSPAGGRLADDAHLMEAWFVDSLAVIEVALYLEKRFGVKLSGVDVSAENFETVGSLAKFIFRRLGGSAP